MEVLEDEAQFHGRELVEFLPPGIFAPPVGAVRKWWRRLVALFDVRNPRQEVLALTAVSTRKIRHDGDLADVDALAGDDTALDALEVLPAEEQPRAAAGLDAAGIDIADKGVGGQRVAAAAGKHEQQQHRR